MSHIVKDGKAVKTEVTYPGYRKGFFDGFEEYFTNDDGSLLDIDPIQAQRLNSQNPPAPKKDSLPMVAQPEPTSVAPTPRIFPDHMSEGNQKKQSLPDSPLDLATLKQQGLFRSVPHEEEEAEMVILPQGRMIIRRDGKEISYDDLKNGIIQSHISGISVDNATGLPHWIEAPPEELGPRLPTPQGVKESLMKLAGLRTCHVSRYTKVKFIIPEIERESDFPSYLTRVLACKDTQDLTKAFLIEERRSNGTRKVFYLSHPFSHMRCIRTRLWDSPEKGWESEMELTSPMLFPCSREVSDSDEEHVLPLMIGPPAIEAGSPSHVLHLCREEKDDDVGFCQRKRKSM